MTAPATPRREPIDHELKSWPRPFVELKARIKRFEIRRNDRDYRPGDRLVIREWDPFAQAFTGDAVTCFVRLVVTAGSYGGVLHGLVGPNAVVLGIEYSDERAPAPAASTTAKRGRRR